MSELVPSSALVAMPLPAVNVVIRQGVPEDLQFIDALQKQHGKQVGWMPTATLEEKIRLGHVLVAEERVNIDGGASAAQASAVGYCIASDQYFKRDDVGIIYQLNVSPGKQRGLIGASLLKAQFEKSAYGCRLYCCWCAQDIAANHFWEAMGFVPLAFRAGSEKKSRVHIFWQKRIRSGDVSTPWWFPSKTTGGSIREDRIVLPIPPGTHWSDAKPLIFPDAPVEVKALPKPKRAAEKRAKAVEEPKPVRRNGLIFAIPRPGEGLPEAKRAVKTKEKAPRAKRKCDPRLAAAARELRDRWLEQVNATPLIDCAKYEVTRKLEEISPLTKRLLAAA
jgi:hypothetical protein